MARRMSVKRREVKAADKLGKEARQAAQDSRFYLSQLDNPSFEQADRQALTHAKLARDRAQSYVEAVEEIVE